MANLNLIAKLGFDGRGFDVGMDKAKRKAKADGMEIGRYLAGAFSVSAISIGVQRLVDKMGRLNDQAEQLGVTTDFLQKAFFSGKQTGASDGSIVGFLERLSDARNGAIDGNKQLLDSFSQLGVGIDSLKTQSLEELFETIGKTIRGGSIANLISPLRDVGGRSAGQVANALRNFQELSQQANIVTDNVVSKLDAIGDKWSSLVDQIVAVLAPVVSAIVDGVQAITDAIGRAAAFYGALTQDVGLKDLLLSANPINAMALAAKVGKNIPAAKEAVGEFNDSVVKREQDIARADQERRAARSQPFIPITQPQSVVEQEKKSESPAPPTFAPATDSLAQIGGRLAGSDYGQSMASDVKRLVQHAQTSVNNQNTIVRVVSRAFSETA